MYRGLVKRCFRAAEEARGSDRMRGDFHLYSAMGCVAIGPTLEVPEPCLYWRRPPPALCAVGIQLTIGPRDLPAVVQCYPHQSP